MRADAALHGWRQDDPIGLAFDTETAGLGFYDPAFCVTVSWWREKVAVSHYLDLRVEEGFRAAQLILSGTEQLVAHNMKFDLQKILLAGLIEPDSLPELHDTEALAHLADEHQPLRLKKLAEKYLGVPPSDEARLVEWFKEHKIKKADRNYMDVPPQILMPYAINDAEITLKLFARLYPLVAEHSDLRELYDMEMDLTKTLERMERRGMRVQVQYLEQKAREYARRALSLELDIRGDVGNPDFNPASWQQIKAVFETRGKSLPGTDAATLSALNDSLADKIVELREVRKIHGTYLLNLLQDQRDGLVHPSFRQHGTRTGRMSSGSATA